VQRCNKLRIEALGLGRPEMAQNERSTNPRLSRRTCTCEYGLYTREARNRRASRKRPREPSPEILNVAIRIACAGRAHLQLVQRARLAEARGGHHLLGDFNSVLLNSLGSLLGHVRLTCSSSSARDLPRHAAATASVCNEKNDTNQIVYWSILLQLQHLCTIMTRFPGLFK
jgi:hypothetical protein